MIAGGYRSMPTDSPMMWTSYFGGGIGAFRMALDLPDMHLAKSNIGIAAKLLVGKEWWVSDKWALGLSLESLAGAVPDDTTQGHVSVAPAWQAASNPALPPELLQRLIEDPVPSWAHSISALSSTICNRARRTARR
jgi:hypothetical protein